MTEKRFTYDKPLVAFSKGGINDNVTGETYEFTMDTVLDLLNALHEENQKCKEYNGILYANHTKTDRELVKQISELKQENEQLKSTINTLTHDNTKMKKVLNTTKKENEHIKNTIKEAYHNERTHIGKSVLKQLMEQIQ